MSYKDRVQAMSDNMSLLAEGEINPLQMGLRAVGEVGGLVGDWTGEAMSAVLPDFVEEGLAHVAQGAMDTGPAKAYMAWAEKNPEQATDLAAAFNVTGLLGGGALGKGTAKSAITAAAHNAPNELAGFYGNGILGQLRPVVAAGPSTIAHMAKDMFTPSGAASLDAGISSRLKSVAKNKVKDIAEGKDPKKAAGFLEGQMDQSSLLMHGAERPAEALDAIFRPVQELGTGDVSGATLKGAAESYKPGMYQPMDEGILDTMMKRAADSNQFPDNGVVVQRHPTGLTDLATEATSKSSPVGKRMYKARQALREVYPDKKGFDSLDEVQEFVAVKALVDDTLVRTKDGKPLTKTDKIINKVIGPGERYKPREEGLTNITNYYKFKKAFEEGPKFTEAELTKFAKLQAKEAAGELSPTAAKQLEKLRHREQWGTLTKSQAEKFADWKSRVERQKNRLTAVDPEKGVVYTRGSHASSAKGLGGVGDEYAIDMKGNVTHVLNDENDLFGFSMPGDKRVLSVTPPSTYNVFNDVTNAPDVAGKAARKAHLEGLETQFGAPFRGMDRVNKTRQMGEALLNYAAPVRGKHYMEAGKNIGTMGLLGALAAREDE